jgi:lipopolysaccharide biosynthesis glycosyltransferase
LYGYINAGVILMNAEKYRCKYTAEDIFEILKTEPFKIVEQDTFNIIVENDIYYLDEKWNCYALGGSYPRDVMFAPETMYREYKRARKNPAIIHYAGYEKPWNYPYTDLANHYWEVVRTADAPLYEMTIFRMITALTDPLVLPLRDTRSTARKFADKLLPKGTRRREFAKIILPKGSLRWRFCKQIYYIFAPQYRPQK